MNKIKQIRKAKGMTMAALADALHVTQSQVSRYENGQSAIPGNRLPDVAAALGVTIGELFEDEAADLIADIRLAPKPAPNAIPIQFEGASMERMREDLPVYGTALGGDLMIEGEAVEQTMLNQGEVSHYAKRPVVLNGNARAYGLHVQGSSMDPVYQDGDLLLAERGRALRIGDDVIVYLRPTNGDDDGERARCVLVKRLVRRTGAYIELRQFSPDLTFRIETTDIVNIDRVLRLQDLIA